MTITINGTTGVTTPEVTVDNSNADGGQVVLKSSGYSNWNIDNYNGSLRNYYGSTVATSIDTSGNVGIGTSSVNANARMQINGRTYMGSNDSVYAAGLFYNNTRASAGQGYYLGATDSTAPSLVFSNNDGTERMRIDSSGGVRIGTTSVVYASEVVAIKATGSNYGLGIETSTGPCIAVNMLGQASGTLVRFDSTGTLRGTISTNGSTVAYNTSSDYRLKENIQPMQNALGVVQQLNPVTYTWKADGSDGQGFIAHELQAVVPDCVTGEKDAVDADGNPVYQGIDTSFLVATLTKAIQEQQEQIEQMKQDIAALKGAA